MAFIFPLMKVRNRLFVSVEINSTIAKLTVWHNEQSAFGLKPQNLLALRHWPHARATGKKIKNPN